MDNLFPDDTATAFCFYDGDHGSAVAMASSKEVSFVLKVL